MAEGIEYPVGTLCKLCRESELPYSCSRDMCFFWSPGVYSVSAGDSVIGNCDFGLGDVMLLSGHQVLDNWGLAFSTQPMELYTEGCSVRRWMVAVRLSAFPLKIRLGAVELNWCHFAAKKGRIIKSQAGATGSEKQRSSGCELHAANISGFILLTSNMGILWMKLSIQLLTLQRNMICRPWGARGKALCYGDLRNPHLLAEAPLIILWIDKVSEQINRLNR